MSKKQTEQEPLDDLAADELVQLAMMAFIYMYDNKTVPDDELLSNILEWFHVMTDDINDIEVCQVTPTDRGVTH